MEFPQIEGARRDDDLGSVTVCGETVSGSVGRVFVSE
jgi:hypothetical protein